MRKILSLMVLFVLALLTVSMVSALSVDNFEWEVEVNGDSVDLGTNFIDIVDEDGNVIGEDIGVGEVAVPSISVDEGQTLDIKVRLQTGEAVEDIEVDAKIKGYEYSDYESLSDSTHVFDMAGNTKKTVKLSIDLPKKLEKQVYWLHLNIYNSNSAPVTQIVKLNVEPTRHGVDIADVVFSPGTTVKAGRSLLTTVLLENFGGKTEKDVKVTVAVPALGVSATEFVDVVETDGNNVDYEDVPEMFLPLPATAVEGEYEVKVTVKYDDLRETVTKSYKINVLSNEMFQAKENKLVLAVGPESQTVAVGSTAKYAIALTNAGTSSKAYLLQAVTGDWATASVSDNLVVLEPGKNKVVYVDVTPSASAAVGEHVTSLAVQSGTEVLETISLKATVTGTTVETGFSLRNGLEIALIILVVLLVIIGLIIGFSRLKRDDEEDEEKTYY